MSAMMSLESFPEYLDSVDRTSKAINIVPYVPVNPILISVLGLEDAKAGRLPTDKEHIEMCRLLEESMEAAAGQPKGYHQMGPLECN